VYTRQRYTDTQIHKFTSVYRYKVIKNKGRRSQDSHTQFTRQRYQDTQITRHKDRTTRIRKTHTHKTQVKDIAIHRYTERKIQKHAFARPTHAKDKTNQDAQAREHAG